jgi:hypothetical protein
MPPKTYGPPRTDFGPAPPGYIPGVGRGAKGFITKGDFGVSTATSQKGFTKGALDRIRLEEQREAKSLLMDGQLLREQQHAMRTYANLDEEFLEKKKKAQEYERKKKFEKEQKEQNLGLNLVQNNQQNLTQFSLSGGNINFDQINKSTPQTDLSSWLLPPPQPTAQPQATYTINTHSGRSIPLTNPQKPTTNPNQHQQSLQTDSSNPAGTDLANIHPVKSTNDDILKLVDPNVVDELYRSKQNLAMMNTEDWFELPEALGILSEKQKIQRKKIEDLNTNFNFISNLNDLDGNFSVKKNADLFQKSLNLDQIGEKSENGLIMNNSPLDPAQKTTLTTRTGTLIELDSEEMKYRSFFAILYHFYPTDLSSKHHIASNQADPKTTLKLLQSKVRTIPNDSKSWLSMIQLQYSLGNLQDARECMKLGLQQCKGSEEMWLFAVRLYATDKSGIGQIENLVKNGVKLCKKSKKLWQLFIELSRHENEKNEKIKHFLNIFCNDLQAWLFYFDSLKNVEEIIEKLTQMLFVAKKNDDKNDEKSDENVIIQDAIFGTNFVNFVKKIQFSEEEKLKLWKLLILFKFYTIASRPIDITKWLVYYYNHPDISFDSISDNTGDLFSAKIDGLKNQKNNENNDDNNDDNSNPQNTPSNLSDPAPRPPNPWEIGYTTIQSLLQQFLSQYATNFDVWIFATEIETRFCDIFYFSTQSLNKLKLQQKVLMKKISDKSSEEYTQVGIGSESIHDIPDVLTKSNSLILLELLSNDLDDKNEEKSVEKNSIYSEEINRCFLTPKKIIFLKQNFPKLNFQIEILFSIFGPLFHPNRKSLELNYFNYNDNYMDENDQYIDEKNQSQIDNSRINSIYQAQFKRLKQRIMLEFVNSDGTLDNMYDVQRLSTRGSLIDDVLMQQPFSDQNNEQNNYVQNFDNFTGSINLFALLSNQIINFNQIFTSKTPSMPSKNQSYDPIHKLSTLLTGAFNVNMRLSQSSVSVSPQTPTLLSLDYCFDGLKSFEQTHNFILIALVCKIWVLPVIKKNYQEMKNGVEIFNFFTKMIKKSKNFANCGYLQTSRGVLLTLLISLVDIAKTTEIVQGGDNLVTKAAFSPSKLRYSSRIIIELITTLLKVDDAINIIVTKKTNKNFLRYFGKNEKSEKSEKNSKNSNLFYTSLIYWSKIDTILSYIYLTNSITTNKYICCSTTPLFLKIITFFSATKNHEHSFYYLSATHLQLEYIRRVKGSNLYMNGGNLGDVVDGEKNNQRDEKIAVNLINHEYWSSIAFYILAYQLKLKQMVPDMVEKNQILVQQSLMMLTKACQDTKEPLLYLHLVQLMRSIYHSQAEVNNITGKPVVVTAKPKYVELLEKLLLNKTQKSEQRNENEQNAQNILCSKYQFLAVSNQVLIDSTYRFIKHSQDSGQLINDSNLAINSSQFGSNMVQSDKKDKNSQQNNPQTSTPKLNLHNLPNLTLQDQQTIGYYLATSPTITTMWVELITFYLSQIQAATLITTPFFPDNSTKNGQSCSPNFSPVSKLVVFLRSILEQCIQFYQTNLPLPTIFTTFSRHHKLSFPIWTHSAISLSYLITYHIPYAYTTSPLDIFITFRAFFESGFYNFPFFSNANTQNLIHILSNTESLTKLIAANTAITYLDQLIAKNNSSHGNSMNFVSNTTLSSNNLTNLRSSPHFYRLRWFFSVLLLNFQAKCIKIDINTSLYSQKMNKNDKNRQNDRNNEGQLGVKIELPNDPNTVQNTPTIQQHFEHSIKTEQKPIKTEQPPHPPIPTPTPSSNLLDQSHQSTVYPVLLRSVLETTTPTVFFPNGIVLNITPMHSTDAILSSGSTTMATDIASQQLTIALAELRPIFNALLLPSENEKNTEKNKKVGNIKKKLTVQHFNWLQNWSQIIVFDIESKESNHHGSILRAVLDSFDLMPLLHRLQHTGDAFSGLFLGNNNFDFVGQQRQNDNNFNANSDPLSLDSDDDDDDNDGDNFDDNNDDDLLRIINGEYENDAKTEKTEKNWEKIGNKISQRGKLRPDDTKLPLPLHIGLHVAKHLWVQNKPSLAYLWFLDSIEQGARLVQKMTALSQFGAGATVGQMDEKDNISAQNADKNDPNLKNDQNDATILPNTTKSIVTSLSHVIDMYSLPTLQSSLCFDLFSTSTMKLSDISPYQLDPVIAQQLYSTTIIQYPLSGPVMTPQGVNTTQNAEKTQNTQKPTPIDYISLGLYPTTFSSLIPTNPTPVGLVQNSLGDGLIWFFLFLTEQCYLNRLNRSKVSLHTTISMANNGMDNNIENTDNQPCLCNAISKCINFVIGKVGVIDGELWRYFSELYLKDLKNVSMRDTMGDDSDENNNMDQKTQYHFLMEKIVENGGICDPVCLHHFSIKMLSFVVKTSLVKHVMKKIIQPCRHQLELD